ncbi:MAG: hypothetical protein MZV63_09240 [Marinilabiliales bacterium]|nr:hypothetical protein [Marinilabiliales bacterium]
MPEIIGAVAGAVGGFIYWKYVGCLSGTCAIKSNWYLMVPWGAVLGFLVGSFAGDIMRRKDKTREQKES